MVATNIPPRREQGSGPPKEYNMTIDMAQAYKKYAQLTQQEKELVRKFMNSSIRQVIRKIFGNHIDIILGTFMLPKSQRGNGLATQQGKQVYTPLEVE
jgi:hypothetical protein